MNARRGLSGDRSKPERRSRVEPGKFTVGTFEKIADDLTGGRLPLPRVTISDEIESGLRAIIRKTGLITYHFNYTNQDGSRPLLKLGDHPELKLNEARELARIIRSLSAKGIDPTEGLHERLMRELLAKGDKWRP